MAVLRAATGPLILGAAIWCAAGAITVADAAHASSRLAVPAPWWVFVLATTVAAAIGPIRRRPLAALPALAVVLPWLPLPVSAATLIWTGPLAWLPIGLAIGIAVGGDLAAVVDRTLRSLPGRRAPVTVAALTALACGSALWWTGDRLRGDEPHYLMIAQSLLRDGDLRIENNHALRQYTPFYRDGPLVPDFTVRGVDGAIYSIHAPGAPALVLPAFALFGWRGAQVFLLMLSTITGVLVWLAGRAVTNDAGAAWFSWAAIVLTPTFLLHSYAVFPDAPAALVTAAAVLLLLRLTSHPLPRVSTAHVSMPRVSTSSLVGVSAMLAALPWLHSRLVVLACGLGGLIAWHIWRGTTGGDGRARAHRLLAFAALPAVSAVAWFAFFWIVYGAPDPRLPYGGDDAARAAWIPGAILGLLFDQQYGLAFHAPVLGAIWWTFLRRSTGRAATVGWQVLGAVLVYLSAVTLFRMWWAGIPSAPARFLVAVVPALAVPAAVAWESADRATRTLLALLLSVGIATSSILVAVDGGALAWNQRDGQARWLEWLAPVVNLPRAWPSFFWTGEAAFLTHLGAVIATLWLAWVVLRRLGLMWQWTGPEWRLASGLWLIVGIGTCASAGWLLTGAGSGLDPTRSQLRIAREAANGRAPIAIGAMKVAAVASSVPRLAIRTEELDRWRVQVRVQSFREVPAGRYRLRVSGPGAATETISATIADSRDPVHRYDPGTLDGAGATLTLAGGASALHLGSPNPDVDMTRWIFTLEPEALWPGSPASRFARLGAVTLAWRDDVFVESDGFWVPGERTAHVSVGIATPLLRLTLGNGPVANSVSVVAGADRWTFAMSPNETRPLEVATPDGVAQIAISSSSGFQPSRVSASRDDRWLGVYVGIR